MNAPWAPLDQPLAFWKEALAGAPTKLDLPTDKPRPALQTPMRARETFSLPSHALDRLNAVAREEEATSFMALAASFLVVLNRYSGQDDILLAAPMRTSTVVLRARFTDDLDFRSLLRQVRDRTLGAHAHGELPFERIVAELVPEPDPSHAPLCQVMFVHNAVDGLPGARTPECDLTLHLSETAAGLLGSIDYSCDLFEAHTIRRLCGHYGVLLESVARVPDQKVQTAPMLTEEERARVLYEWNDTSSEVPETCAHRLFEDQVARTPDATALVFEKVTLTYRELNQRANQVAHHLRTHGVGPEVLVGVCLGRSADLAIALLGVWKAGGAYVPLDPTLPPERRAFMLRDASAKVLVTDADGRAALGAVGLALVCMDADGPLISKESTVNPDARATSSNLAYVMYTSGSTGHPKGVMIVHEGLVNYLLWARGVYAADSGDAVPVHSSIAFDLTVTALYVPLVCGGSIEMLREDVGGQNLVASLRRGHDRSLVKITPAHLALLNEVLGADVVGRRTKLFVVGGENLLAESLLPWRDHAPGTRLINEYGPTETVVGCCVYEIAAGDPRTGSVPIGRPIANTLLYVLDRHMNPLPPGIVGELYIGGAGVARGYLNRPELTGERFLADPFARKSGARMYRTGDLARHRVDGTLEYLGRVDNQVKVRGYRIELGEIEATLADQAGVTSCAVLARGDVPGNKQLVAYVVTASEGRTTAEELRRSLGRTLPEYMVPARVVFLDAMPLTTNGKVDRKALPAPSSARMPAPELREATPRRVPARTQNERKLLAIWKEVLGIDEVGIHDDFFELGGHSLQAVRAMAQAQEVFAMPLSAQALFEAPTIARLAEIIGQEGWTPTWSSLVPIQTAGTRQAFFLVHAIGGNVYNYRLLSKHLGADQPFYGLQARGMDGKEPPHEAVEEMAADYIREMRQLETPGAAGYQLGGASSGGVIAFEMAQQLVAMGERVSVVVMLDTVRPGAPPPRIVEALAGSRRRRLTMRFDYHLGGLLLRSPADAVKYVRDLIRWRRSGPEGQIAAAIKAEDPTLANVIRANRRALAKYVPRPYPKSVVMLLLERRTGSRVLRPAPCLGGSDGRRTDRPMDPG